MKPINRQQQKTTFDTFFVVIATKYMKNDKKEPENPKTS
jgi:hypothetical protein